MPERETRLRAIASEISATSKKRAEAAGKEAKAEENLRKLDDARRFAERVPALEAEQLRLRGDRERLLTTIQHHRDSRSLSAGGQCPFLREPCLNIQRRGLSSLETFFDGEIARDEQQVGPSTNVSVPSSRRSRGHARRRPTTRAWKATATRMSRPRRRAPIWTSAAPPWRVNARA